MCLLGCDIGSSSVKVSIIERETGHVLGADFFPKEEAPIHTPQALWADQNPEDWWLYLKQAIKRALDKATRKDTDIKTLGIS